MAPFKVIIIGGSISGLVLAKTFEEYGIDYELLEKHEKIAPQVGAGFAIWPNGARVLDQLGCFEALENANEAVDELTVYDVGGKLRDYRPQFGRWMQSMSVNILIYGRFYANAQIGSAIKCGSWSAATPSRAFGMV